MARLLCPDSGEHVPFEFVTTRFDDGTGSVVAQGVVEGEAAGWVQERWYAELVLDLDSGPLDVSPAQIEPILGGGGRSRVTLKTSNAKFL